MPTLIYIILIIIVAGAAAMLIKKAPFIDAEYKPYALWFLMLIVVILVLYALVPFLSGLQLPSRR